MPTRASPENQSARCPAPTTAARAWASASWSCQRRSNASSASPTSRLTISTLRTTGRVLASRSPARAVKAMTPRALPASPGPGTKPRSGMRSAKPTASPRKPAPDSRSGSRRLISDSRPEQTVPTKAATSWICCSWVNTAGTAPGPISSVIQATVAPEVIGQPPAVTVRDHARRDLEEEAGCLQDGADQHELQGVEPDTDDQVHEVDGEAEGVAERGDGGEHVDVATGSAARTGRQKPGGEDIESS
jgi:hypothetical protein